MVTPHIPPYQSANAILPQILAEKLVNDGHRVSFIVPESALSDKTQPGDYLLTSFNMERGQGLSRKIKADILVKAKDIYSKTKELLGNVDVVHLHSNGLLHQIVTVAAERSRVPHIITHYGTEIWHYKSKKIKTLDPFLYMNKTASAVVYYSRKLQEFSYDTGVVPDNPVTIYPPAGEEFKPHSETERKKLRDELGLNGDKVLINVKRLHPLGGHEYLIKAMPEIVKHHPGTQLYICGDGDLRADLEALSKKLGMAGNITFLGMVDNREIWKYYAASDLYVLSSVLEALPTVAVEAIAAGTRVVITDTPGGKELKDLFDEDLYVCPMRDEKALAETVNKQLNENRRAGKKSMDTVNKYFRVDSMYDSYLELYKQAIEEK
jgi:glycosyltransferase involved in cell wall biosynthesis